MEIYEVLNVISPTGEETVKCQWTSEGIIIEERVIPIEDIDWCKTTQPNKLEFELRDGTSVYLKYIDEEKDKIKRVKKGVRKAVEKIDNAKAHEEAKIYCEIFEDMTAFGKTMIKGKWTYDGMLIGSKMIPVEEIEDCKFVASGYSYFILFELKNGKYERFELANEEQYEQGRRAVMMIIKQISKLESGEWKK